MQKKSFLWFVHKDFARFYHAGLVHLLVRFPAYEKIIISPAHMMPEITDDINKEKIRIMPNGKTDSLCFMVKDSTETLMFLRNANHPSHNAFAIRSDSKSMVDSMMTLFDYSWENSELVYQVSFY